MMCLVLGSASAATKSYELITSDTELEADANYILVGINSGNYYVMGYQNTNNRPAVAVSSPLNNIISVETATTNSDQTNAYAITLGGTADNWTLYVDVNNGYLRPRTGNSNGLQTNAVASTWTISIGNNGVATITCTGAGGTSFARNILRFNYNGGNPLFACYQTGQLDIFLYKEVTTTTPSTITWLGTTDSDWNKTSNWQEEITPTQYDDVIIPATATNYPILESTATINNITFEPGAEIGNQHLLTHQKATINYNLEKDRWNMITTPIATTIEQSFHFDKAPSTWIQTFVPTENEAGWEYIKTLDHSFDIGDGFVFRVEGTGNYPFSIEGDLANTSVSKTLNFVTEQSSAFALVGNPFMSTIDFSKLIESNTIAGSYIIWTETGYVGYNETTGSNFGITTFELDKYIAPLQSFIVEKGTNTGDLIFNATIQATGSGSELRTSESKNNKLDIIAENETASVLTFIANRENGQDSRKLFSEKSDIPDIYTLKGETALGANIINTNNLLVPIRLSTTHNGNINFTFSGMDSYDAKITFIDTERENIDITGLSTYTYSFDNTPAEERFFIQFAPTGETNTNNPTSGSTNIYSKDQAIHIISTDAIKQIIIYNTQGQTIYSNNNVNTSSIKINGKKDPVYIVKVVTEKEVKNIKLINQ